MRISIIEGFLDAHCIDENLTCGYFEWVDYPITTQAWKENEEYDRKAINMLKKKVAVYKNEMFKLRIAYVVLAIIPIALSVMWITELM